MVINYKTLITKLDKANYLLWAILIIAFIMRVMLVWNMSFSPNELSLIEKVNSGLSNLFNAKDYVGSFPSGFLFFHFIWIKITGTNELLLRLPAITASVASVFLTFRIAQQWFNKYTALLSAAMLSVLQFPVMYAQQALPFSFGLLFVLLSVYLWWKALFNNADNKRKPFLFFALSLAVTGYFQNFTLILLLVVILTGFIYVKKTNFKNYLISIIIAAVIYQPQLFFLLRNLVYTNIAETGAWIVKPNSNMILSFIFYCINNSQFLVYAFFVYFIYSNIESFGEIKFNRFLLIAVLWFFVPVAFAYFYSQYQTPFAETPIFLFVLPFLLMAFFSFTNPQRIIINITALILLTLVGVFSTSFEQKYYNTYHYAEVKNIAKQTATYIDTYSNDSITKIINIKSPYYIDLYTKKTGKQITFAQYSNDGHYDLLELSKIIEVSKTPYFLQAWSGVFNPHECQDLIMAKYPFIVSTIDYNNKAGITLFSKYEKDAVIKPKAPIYYVFNGFEDGNTWDKSPSMISTEKVKYDKYALKISPNDIYGPSCTNLVSKMYDKPIKNIRVSLWAYCTDIPKDAQIVATISFKDEDNQIFENYFWLSSKLEYFVEKGKWGQAFFSFNLPVLKSINDEVKIYVWNPDKNTIFIDNFELKAYTE